MPARAESARSLVERGNEHYAKGSYKEALEAYQEAAKELPESAEILFNEGNIYFHKGDYQKAREAYEAAALHAKDLSLEAKSQFNLGNTAFAEAGELLKGDLKKGLERYGVSIQHYRNALRLDPNLKQAAENIEMARLKVKDLLDQIKNREEQEKERRKQQEALRKELQETIKEQDSEIADNRSATEEMGENPEGDFQDRLENLEADQKATRDRTENMVRRLNSSEPQMPSDAGGKSTGGAQERQEPGQEIAKHIENALGAQESALDGIRQRRLDEAKDDQEEALKELKEALAKLEKPENTPSQNEPRQEGADEEQQNKEGDQPDRQSSGQNVEQREKEAKKDKSPSQKAGQALPPGGEKPEDRRQQPLQTGKEGEAGDELVVLQEKPEDILREEKENRLRFERARKGGYQPVEKDW